MQRTTPTHKTKHTAGRKSKFKQTMLREVYNYAVLGATDKQISDLIGVQVSTFDKWKASNPKLADTLERGKCQADALVEQALYHKAIGYSHPDIQYFNYRGRIIAQPCTKHYPPDTTAQIFWLKNRRRERWAEVSELHMKHSGSIGLRKIEDIPIAQLTPEEQEVLFTLNMKQLTNGASRN